MLAMVLVAAFGAETWYVPADIGQHVDRNGVTPERLSPEQAKKVFQRNGTLTPEAHEEYQRLKADWFAAKGQGDGKKFQDDRCFRLDGKSHELRAEPYTFSRTKVRVRIQFPYGHSRWHHFHVVLREFEVERDAFIDGSFGLKELEDTYAFTHKGLGHGSSGMEVEEILGEEFHEYSGQSPSFRRVYYENDGIHIVIQEGVVMYLQKGRPEWMDTGPKRAPGEHRWGLGNTFKFVESTE